MAIKPLSVRYSRPVGVEQVFQTKFCVSSAELQFRLPNVLKCIFTFVTSQGLANLIYITIRYESGELVINLYYKRNVPKADKLGSLKNTAHTQGHLLI